MRLATIALIEPKSDRTKELKLDPVVGVFGHFAAGTDRVDGQIYRSRLVLSELQNRLGTECVHGIDTGHLARHPFSTLMQLRRAVKKCTDIVIMPNTRGLRWLFPIYLRWKKKFGIKIHYFVVGGWLPQFIQQRPQDVERLHNCAGIYVQTRRMFDELTQSGLTNLELLPNFRNFPLDRKLSVGIGSPFRLVYLSRILPEKGPHLAIQAVEEINRQFEQSKVTLDLWGPVQKGNERWFKEIIERVPDCIQYRGVVDPEMIPETLARYDAMVFPTYYSGEGFPGAILDAQISGLPIIASDWQDNAEFVKVGSTGLLFKSQDVTNLKEKIVWMLENPSEFIAMKRNAFESSSQFHVDQIFPALLEKMGLVSAVRADH